MCMRETSNVRLMWYISNPRSRSLNPKSEITNLKALTSIECSADVVHPHSKPSISSPETKPKITNPKILTSNAKSQTLDCNHASQTTNSGFRPKTPNTKPQNQTPNPKRFIQHLVSDSNRTFACRGSEDTNWRNFG